VGRTHADKAVVDSLARSALAGVFTKVAAGTKADLPVEGTLPGFSGAVEWLNSAPLTPQALRGKVVLVNFWTYNCINYLSRLESSSGCRRCRNHSQW
jgi:hypothetical protein